MQKPFVALAVLLASYAPMTTLAAQGAQPQVVSVELSSFRFAPAEIALRHGQAYRLHLVNGTSYAVAQVSGLVALAGERGSRPLASSLVRASDGKVAACATVLGKAARCP